MGNKIAAREAMEKAGLPLLPGARGVLRDGREAEKLAKEIGFPVILKAASGGGGRGHEDLPRGRPGPAALRHRLGRGPGRLRRRLHVPGALRRAAPPHRAADPGRRARQRDPPGRARVLGAAAPPEAHRGGPQPGRHTGAAPRDGRGGGPGHARGRLQQRRDGRVPAGRARPLLLHGDEHAHPGGAPGHRAGVRPGPAPGADPPGGRRAPGADAGLGRAAGPRHRAAASTPRIRSRSHPRPGPSPGTTSPAATGSGSTRWRTSSTACSRSTTRWSPSWW